MNPLDRLLGRLYDHWFGVTKEEEARCKAAADRAWRELHLPQSVVDDVDFQLWEKECRP